MNTYTKLLVASALLASFAVPAIADVQPEGQTLENRNVYTNPPMRGEWSKAEWSKAYAMDSAMHAQKPSRIGWSYRTDPATTVQ